MTGMPAIQGQDRANVLGDAIGPFLQNPNVLGDLIGPTLESMRPKTTWDHVVDFSLHAVNAATAVADATAHLGTFASKLGAGAASLVSGEGFGAGYDAMSELYRQKTGTKDPGFLDLGNNILRAVGIDTGRTPTAGVELNSYMRKQLGDQLIYSQTVGNIVSMGSGLGARVANMAAAPISKAVGKALVKAQAKKAGVLFDDAAKLAKDGRVWDVIASSPQWMKTAGIVDKMMVAAGRKKLDLLGNAAGNIAQSYLMSPDDERLRGALAAGLITPFAVPIARIGQDIANRILARGVTGEAAERASALMREFGEGNIGLKELDAELSGLMSSGRKVFAGATASAFEGTAFTMLQPESYTELKKFMQGDMDAGARLLGMLASTAGGVAALRGLGAGIPMDLAPMFKTLRPDLNTLDLYIEAEANARRLREQDQEPKAAADAEKSPEGLFVDPLAPLVPEAPKIQMPSPLRPQGERSKDGVQFMGDVDPVQMQMEADYGWAVGYSTAPLKSGFQPKFEDGGQVRFQHGRDFSFTISPSNEGMVLHIDPKVANAMREAGLAMSNYDVLAPTIIEFRGDNAVKTMRDLALLARLRMMDGAIQFQQMGMKPGTIEPWTWKNTETGQTYMMQLDGSIAVRNLSDGANWSGVEEYHIVNGGDIGPPKTDINDLLIQTLSETLVAKHALAPDNLVDSTIGRAITLARFGDGVAADNLREFFRTQDPATLLARVQPGKDVDFAMQLGAIATGFDLPMPPVPPAAAAGDNAAVKTAGDDAGKPTDPTAVSGASDESVAMSGVDPRPALRELGRSIKPDIPKLNDYVFETQAEVISKNIPDTDVGYRARSAVAEAAEITGRASEKFEPARKALKTKEGKELQKFVQMAGDERSFEPAYLELADNLRKPVTKVEADIQKGFQDVNEYTWNVGADAGFVRQTRGTSGAVVTRPMQRREKGKAKQPREFGNDFYSVLEDSAERAGYFKSVERLNPDATTIDSKSKKPRRLTADDLENMWQQKSISQSGTTNPDRKNAIEMIRAIDRVPYVWVDSKGVKREMFESNPFKLFSKSVTKGAQRLATDKEFGQDVEAAERKALLEDKSISDAVRANLEKGGLTNARKQLEEKIKKLPDTSRASELMTTADEMFARIQASQPVESPFFNKTFLGKSIRDAGVVRSSASSAKSFFIDLPEVFLGRFQAIAGIKKSYKAIAEVAGSREEMRAWARRSGAIDAYMNEWVWNEASSIAKKMADFAGIPSQYVETLKATIAARIAEATIQEIKAGNVTVRDLLIAQDMMRLSPEQVMDIRNGKMSESLERQFRREYTQLLTSRVTPAEGSRFAANPNVTALLAFVRWATNRTMSNIRALSSVFRSAKRSGWFSAENRSAMGMVLGNAIGMGTNFVGGRMLYDLMTGFVGAAGSLLSGEPTAETIEDGFKKVWREIREKPFTSALQAVASQSTGGPFSQVTNLAIGDFDRADSWARLTHPSALAFYAFKAARSALSGDETAAIRFMQDAGFIPFNKDMKTFITMTKAPMVREAALDAAVVNEWKRRNNIDQKISKFDGKRMAFYAVLEDVRNFALKNPGNPKDITKAASEKIKAALDLRPKDSVASSLYEMQILDHLTPVQRSDFAQFMGEDRERLNRIYLHDQLIRDIAGEIRKLPDEVVANESEWRVELDAIRSNAGYGASDQWKKFVEKTIDEVATSVHAGLGAGSKIEELANAMSIYPNQLEGAVGSKAFRMISRRNTDAGTVQRLLVMNMTARMRDQVSKIREAAMRANRDEQR